MASPAATEQQGPRHRLLTRWPGRVALATVAGFQRLEIFDRAMAIAAQLFTAVFPILIMISVWVGASTSRAFAESVSMPPVAQEVLQQALDESGDTAFGLVGTVFVLVSATSLSRALTRAMATIWQLPRPKTRLTSAWRWVAVVLALALAALVARTLGQYTQALPPHDAWPVVLTFLLDTLIAVSIPWLLLAGQVSTRRLVPGALAFALVMLVGRPASSAYLPRALEQSADQYGSIGVAFTYLASLYAVSFVFLATQILGSVVADDQGGLGKFIRSDSHRTPDDPSPRATTKKAPRP
jgi:membrane protein